MRLVRTRLLSYRNRLLPYMQHYYFPVPEQPYLLWFQKPDESTEAFNTDHLGFRFTVSGDRRTSPGTYRGDGPVRLLAGSSSVFGVGASTDETTIASRLWTEYAPAEPWFAFGGQAFNSAQELVLLTLFHHMLPPVSEIVLFSGVNNLVVSRLPEEQQGVHGAHYQAEPPADDAVVPGPAERVQRASDRTAAHLRTWQALANAMGARLVFALQPLAPWVREEPSKEEKKLFAELDKASNFRSVHSDIVSMDVGRDYAAALEKRCQEIGVPFLNTTQLLAERATPKDWLFVDRVHMTDGGYDMVARILAEELELR
ncbi:Inducer of phenazine A [Streptomyces sp. CB03238]|uniref:SGNH/GDSL hydrolase family protein n=1 Tax=Streptomyces sp. CB03238 TaxID=1907777 RepID=UPI001F4E1B16|nr:Inducer of phenazine A [Streptomyces sp. CB03238]